MLLIPSERRMFRPAFPTRCAAVIGPEQRTSTSATTSSTLIDERSSVVFRFGRMALPTSDEMLASAAGSEPLSGVKGDPLCSENCELTCQPPRHPSTLLITVDRQLVHKVSGNAMRAIEARSAAIRASIVRVLRDSNLTGRHVENL